MYREEIKKFFENEKENLVNDICEMIKIPSFVTEPSEGYPYGKNAAAAVDKFIEIADRMGFETKNVDYRAAFAAYGKEPRAIDILAHVDVVPALEGWTVTDGYTPLVKDGKIYGRGAMDDKGPAIAALYAIYAIKTLGIPLNKGVRMVVGSNEENSAEKEDLLYYVEREGEAEMTLCPDGDFPVINVEKGALRGKVTAKFPTDDVLPQILSIDGGIKRYVIPGEAKASIQGIEAEELKKYAEEEKKQSGIEIIMDKQEDGILYLTAKGKETHVGAPEAGNNAVTGLIRFLCRLPFAQTEGFRKLQKLYEVFPHGDYFGKAAGIERHTEDTGDLFSTLNIFHYTRNGFEGSYDCKLPNGCTKENTEEVMLRNLRERGITVKDSMFKPALYVPMDGRLVKTALKYYEEYTGQKGYGVTISGVTYANVLNKTAVTFGCTMPGEDNRIHMGDEYVVIDRLIMSAEIYAEIIIELCS